MYSVYFCEPGDATVDNMVSLCVCYSEFDFVPNKKLKSVPKIRKHSSFQTPQAILARLRVVLHCIVKSSI